MMDQQQGSVQYFKPLAPSEEVKKYIIQLSRDCTELLAETFGSVEKRYAFGMKTRAFSIWLEPYTEPEIKKKTFEHYNELDEKIRATQQEKELNDQTKAQSIASLIYQYGIEVYYQSIRILQNSKILEQEVEGVIDLANDPGPRIRGEVKGTPLMKSAFENIEEDKEEDNVDAAITDQPGS